MRDLNAKVGNVKDPKIIGNIALANKMKEIKDLQNSIMKTTW